MSLPPKTKVFAGMSPVAGVIGLIIVVAVVAIIPVYRTLSQSSTVASTPAPAVWTTWTAPDGTFRIDFPGTPTVIPSQQANVRGTAASVDLGASGYGAIAIEPEPGAGGLPDTPEAFLAVVNGAIKGGGLSATSMQAGTFAGIPSYDFSASGTVDGIDVDAKGMALRVGDRVYIFLGIGTPSQPAPGWDQFIQSFHIT